MFALLILVQSYGQKCEHSNLSKNYHFITSLKRFGKNGGKMGFYDIEIEIISKSTKQKQIVLIRSELIFEKDYLNCNAVRSYSTNVNTSAKVQDNDYGDLIVADFNFDGNDDVAFKNDSGGNGGPLYSFYLQSSKGTFIEDKFLSETVQFFPNEINIKNKTIITLVHANAYQRSEDTYKLDKNGNWKQIKSRLVE